MTRMTNERFAHIKAHCLPIGVDRLLLELFVGLEAERKALKTERQKVKKLEAIPGWEIMTTDSRVPVILRQHADGRGKIIAVSTPEQEGMRTGALPDWTKHNHPAQLAIREQARIAESARLAELNYDTIPELKLSLKTEREANQQLRDSLERAYQKGRVDGAEAAEAKLEAMQKLANSQMKAWGRDHLYYDELDALWEQTK